LKAKKAGGDPDVITIYDPSSSYAAIAAVDNPNMWSQLIKGLADLRMGFGMQMITGEVWRMREEARKERLATEEHILRVNWEPPR
jgi:hypothetical protein